MLWKTTTPFESDFWLVTLRRPDIIGCGKSWTATPATGLGRELLVTTWTVKSCAQQTSDIPNRNAIASFMDSHFDGLEAFFSQPAIVLADRPHLVLPPPIQIESKMSDDDLETRIRSWEDVVKKMMRALT